MISDDFLGEVDPELDEENDKDFADDDEVSDDDEVDSADDDE